MAETQTRLPQLPADIACEPQKLFDGARNFAGAGIGREQQKILQSYFTTKPTGDSTGLGLSLRFHIVDKGHSGTLAASHARGLERILYIRLPQA
ncbi:ATP-binding protein [Hymenobacter terricola]|uniref:hypothetical protein n=1 Tax=Hymenobacter terricola TaxID=2819236 RepID=UPI001B304201|nr:hypothetical protein [Hymenobacter terricola]